MDKICREGQIIINYVVVVSEEEDDDGSVNAAVYIKTIKDA